MRSLQRHSASPDLVGDLDPVGLGWLGPGLAIGRDQLGRHSIGGEPESGQHQTDGAVEPHSTFSQVAPNALEIGRSRPWSVRRDAAVDRDDD